MRDPHDHHHYVSNLDRIDTGNQVGNLDLLRNFPFHIPLLHTTLLQFKPKKKRKKKKKIIVCVSGVYFMIFLSKKIKVYAYM